MMLTVQSFERLRQILVLFYHLHLCVFRNTGEIIVPPTDEEAVVSQNVTLKCQSNIKTQFPVAWRHKQLGSNKYDEPLYEDGYILNGNGNGNGHPLSYAISGNASDGEFNLVISNVTLQNAGRYTCVETSGAEKTAAELIVYESYPNILNCLTNQPSDYFVGANEWGIVPDTLQFSCNVSYSGNLEPVLEWIQGNKTLTNSTVKRNILGILTLSSFEVTANDISSPDFQCRIWYSNSNIKSKFVWMTTVQVLVVDTKTKIYNVSCRESPIQSVNCSIATFQQCSYMWKKSNSDWSISGSIINFTSADEIAVYTCHDACLVHGTNYSFIPARVAFTCDMSDNGGINIAVAIIVTILVCAIVAVAVIVYLKVKRRRKEETAASRAETSQLQTGEL